MTSRSDAIAPPVGACNTANALLALFAKRARREVYEGFLSQLGAELGISPTRVSRAVRVLRDAQRIEVLQRGHGRHPSRLRVVSTLPLRLDRTASNLPALADRLLEHLSSLSDDGFVERPLVDVAKQLDVGPPSVSRALGRLVDDGLARVDRVGTRGRPTRIALVPSLDGTAEDEMQQLRDENRRLAAEMARLRTLLDSQGER